MHYEAEQHDIDRQTGKRPAEHPGIHRPGGEYLGKYCKWRQQHPARQRGLEQLQPLCEVACEQRQAGKGRRDQHAQQDEQVTALQPWSTALHQSASGQPKYRAEQLDEHQHQKGTEERCQQ